MNILNPILRTKSGNHHVIFLTDGYTQVPRAIPVAVVTLTQLNNWVIPYVIQIYLLTSNGMRFVYTLFMAITVHLGIEQLDNDCMSCTNHHASGKCHMNHRRTPLTLRC